nr:hypothetical protein [Candidatus Freyarchaeota archaeon]
MSKEVKNPLLKGSGLVMVVTMQILTRLSSFGLLPVSGYKNGWMHILVPPSSAEPLNATLPWELSLTRLVEGC